MKLTGFKVTVTKPLNTLWKLFVSFAYIKVGIQMIQAMQNGMDGTNITDHIVFIAFILSSVINTLVTQAAIVVRINEE